MLGDFYELYECFVTSLDAILSPADHLALLDYDEDWHRGCYPLFILFRP